MKNVSLKKLMALTLSALIIATLLVPITAISAQAVAPSSFPEPIMSSAPTYLKEFAKPDVTVVPESLEEYVFTSKVTGEAEEGAPVIATITEQAGPNDSISIYGTNLEGATVYAYGLENGKGVIKKLLQTSNKDGFINAIITDTFDYTMYTVWVQGEDGKVSAPVRVNAPKLTWISDTSATSGAKDVRIYGKFLTTNNADGENAKSYVYITNGTNVYKATVTEATPYRLTVDLPALADGNYKVWVHNGHGGEYGFSNSLDLKISSTATITWDDSKIVTVNPGDSLKNKIAGATKGSTIYIKNGVYVITSQISVSKSLRIVGESKDGVIIVCVFTQNGSGGMAYGDYNVNSACKAAFSVSATPCEFSNLTFADYVEGEQYCENITKPSNYSIDYAHGMFIYGAKGTNTGISGSFKIDNCNFKIRRLYSDTTNCIYLSSTQQETAHTAIEKTYGTRLYSRKQYGSTPIWLDTYNGEVSNCYFEINKGLITRNTRGTYIHDNTFAGTWLISGNSGPNAIYDTYSRNYDISNNRIYGLDEIEDPNGYVEYYDKTFARTLVFQKVYNVTQNVYIMNNNISRVGELDYNSGEHILFEDENVTYVGKVTLSNNNKTMHLKDMPTDKWTSDNQFKGYITGDDGVIKPASYTKSVVGQYVVITKGKGAGQYREITSVKADRYVTISKDWDVQPDENSTFVVVSPVIDTVIYKNKIEGPKLYQRNFNSTLGVQAYASMVGTIIDRNDFSQMQAGMSINPHYNMKSYTYNNATVQVDFGFVMFADLLVMGNTIRNTRYGIWNFPSITLASIDASSAEAATDLQICSIIRNNNISDSNRLVGGSSINNAVTTDYKKRGGASIVIGRDYWSSDMVLSTRYWMNNVVVENNVLSDVENNGGKGFIDVAFSQDNTILRNNLTDGVFKQTYAEVRVERNSTAHRSRKTPQLPVYYLSNVAPDQTDYGAVNSGGQEGTTHPSYYGTAADGFNSVSSSWPMALKPADTIYNLDFELGFVYWSGKKYESASDPGSLASDNFKLVTEDGNTYITLKENGYVDTLRTALFKASNVSVGDTLVLIYDAKGSDAEKIRVTLKQDHIRGSQYVTYDEETGLNTNTANNPSPGTPNTLVSSSASLSVYGEPTSWTTYVTGSSATVNDPTTVSTSKPCTSDIYLQIIIEKASGVNVGDTLDVAIDNIRIAKVIDGAYYDITTLEEIKAPVIVHPSYYGTEADGFNSVSSSWPMALKPADTIYNLDFERGFIYWSGKKYENASDPGSLASDSFKLVTEGDNTYITLKENGYVDTLRTALFKVSGVSVGDKLVLIYDAKGADVNKIKVTLKQDHIRGSQYVTYDEETGLNVNTANNPSPGTPNILVSSSATLTTFSTASAGWTTYLTGSSATVNDPTTVSTSKPCTSDIYLQIIIEKATGVSVGDKLDVAIDNIRIAKVVDSAYYDIATGEEIKATGEGLENGGSGNGGSGSGSSGGWGDPTPPADDNDDPQEDEFTADTLAWLIDVIVKDKTDSEADFNSDGKVNLLDVVFVKKKLAGINYGQ